MLSIRFIGSFLKSFMILVVIGSIFIVESFGFIWEFLIIIQIGFEEIAIVLAE